MLLLPLHPIYPLVFGAGYIGSPQCVWTESESESVITVYDVCLQWEWRMILTICPFPFHFGFVEFLFLQKKLKSVLYHVFYFGLFWMMRVSVSIVDRHSAGLILGVVPWFLHNIFHE